MSFRRGRRLALDIGSVRIGVAQCDPDGILATPVGTVQRRGGDAAAVREILGLIADGKSNREISSELFVTESTVKWHVRKLMEKLDARSRWQAVVHAKSRGLI